MPVKTASRPKSYSLHIAKCGREKDKTILKKPQNKAEETINNFNLSLPSLPYVLGEN